MLAGWLPGAGYLGKGGQRVSQGGWLVVGAGEQVIPGWTDKVGSGSYTQQLSGQFSGVTCFFSCFSLKECREGFGEAKISIKFPPTMIAVN